MPRPAKTSANDSESSHNRLSTSDCIDNDSDNIDNTNTLHLLPLDDDLCARSTLLQLITEEVDTTNAMTLSVTHTQSASASTSKSAVESMASACPVYLHASLDDENDMSSLSASLLQAHTAIDDTFTFQHNSYDDDNNPFIGTKDVCLWQTVDAGENMLPNKQTTNQSYNFQAQPLLSGLCSTLTTQTNYQTHTQSVCTYSEAHNIADYDNSQYYTQHTSMTHTYTSHTTTQHMNTQRVDTHNTQGITGRHETMNQQDSMSSDTQNDEHDKTQTEEYIQSSDICTTLCGLLRRARSVCEILTISSRQTYEEVKTKKQLALQKVELDDDVSTACKQSKVVVTPRHYVSRNERRPGSKPHDSAKKAKLNSSLITHDDSDDDDCDNSFRAGTHRQKSATLRMIYQFFMIRGKVACTLQNACELCVLFTSKDTTIIHNMTVDAVLRKHDDQLNNLSVYKLCMLSAGCLLVARHNLDHKRTIAHDKYLRTLYTYAVSMSRRVEIHEHIGNTLTQSSCSVHTRAQDVFRDTVDRCAQLRLMQLVNNMSEHRKDCALLKGIDAHSSNVLLLNSIYTALWPTQLQLHDHENNVKTSRSNSEFLFADIYEHDVSQSDRQSLYDEAAGSARQITEIINKIEAKASKLNGGLIEYLVYKTGMTGAYMLFRPEYILSVMTRDKIALHASVFIDLMLRCHGMHKAIYMPTVFNNRGDKVGFLSEIDPMSDNPSFSAGSQVTTEVFDADGHISIQYIRKHLALLQRHLIDNKATPRLITMIKDFIQTIDSFHRQQSEMFEDHIITTQNCIHRTYSDFTQHIHKEYGFRQIILPNRRHTYSICTLQEVLMQAVIIDASDAALRRALIIVSETACKAKQQIIDSFVHIWNILCGPEHATQFARYHIQINSVMSKTIKDIVTQVHMYKMRNLNIVCNYEHNIDENMNVECRACELLRGGHYQQNNTIKCLSYECLNAAITALNEAMQGVSFAYDADTVLIAMTESGITFSDALLKCMLSTCVYGIYDESLPIFERRLLIMSEIRN